MLERLEALMLMLDVAPLTTKRSLGKFGKALETKKRQIMAHIGGFSSNQILGVLADWCVILIDFPPQN